MKTIRVSNTNTSKSVKKIMINRYYSGVLTSIKNIYNPITFPLFSFPIKKSKTIAKHDYGSQIQENEGHQLFFVDCKFSENCLHPSATNLVYRGSIIEKTVNHNKNFHRQQKFQQNAVKSISKQLRNDKSGSTFANTERESEIKKNNNNLQSQYFNVEYVNPNIKLKNLQNQRNRYKGKWIKNLQEIIKIQNDINDLKTKKKLQELMYQSMIKKLKRKTRSEIIYHYYDQDCEKNLESNHLNQYKSPSSIKSPDQEKNKISSIQKH